MKEVIKLKRKIESSNITIPELEEHIGKIAEITITIECDLVGRSRLRDRLMNNVTYLSEASFLDADTRERFDFR